MSAQHPHHLGRLQAAGMAASMFPPNPMFNLHPPTTPPKQSSSQSSQGVAGSNPAQYPPTSSGASHRSATSLARLQQLTNGLENTPGGGGGSNPAGVSPVTTSGNSASGNPLPGAKPSKQNSALLAPSYYPGQQPGGQPQTPGHHPNTPGVPGSTPGSHGRPTTPASRNHQNLIAHQYSAQNHMALNYPGYPPGYLNPWNMYHQAAAPYIPCARAQLHI